MRLHRKILNILVSAGATREPLDPVRFISNYSTGFLGCEIAREAKRSSELPGKEYMRKKKDETEK